jgi:Tol biopolymer transport system component
VKIGLLALAVAALALGGSAQGGISVPPPPGDYASTWSPDASVLVFYRGVAAPGGELWVANPDGSSARPLVVPPSPWYALSPDWRWVAIPRYQGAEWVLTVVHPDGTVAHDLGPMAFATHVSWAPDSSRLVFQRRDGLYVGDAEGTSIRRITTKGYSPAWSPRGDLIAFVADTGTSLQVVEPDGTPTAWNVNLGNSVLRGDPQWSPDGTRLAYAVAEKGHAANEVDTQWVDPRMVDHDSWPVKGYVSSVRWSPDGTRIAFAGEAVGVVDVRTKAGARTIAHGGEDVAWSPDSRHIAYSAGGECRNRVGLYVADVTSLRTARITQDCRILGTDGPDTLRGTDLADVLVGLAGDDRISGTTGPDRAGDTLEGDAGNDLLVGTASEDTLTGGSGDDTLSGGFNADDLTGGPGRDVLRGEGGADVIYARDGERDVVSCGTNTAASTAPYGESDVAYVDRVDAVSKDCEYVYRPGAVRATGRTSLRIRVTADSTKRPPTERVYTLACRPARGTLPHRSAACARLSAIQNPFAPVPRNVACSQIYGGPQRAIVTGTFDGKLVHASFVRTDGCQVARWNRVKFLFPL